MGLRERFTEELKTAMKAGNAARVSTLRLILARLKETDIAARPGGTAPVDEFAIQAMLQSMIRSRRESIELYRQGHRPDLVAKEEAEILVIESFLPQPLNETALEEAVSTAIAETGAAEIKDMGKVMAVLKARHGAALDLARVGPLVKARLGPR